MAWESRAASRRVGPAARRGVGSSSVVARGSSSVVARESSSVEAWGSSRVEARESSRVEAWEDSNGVKFSKKAQMILHDAAAAIDRTEPTPSFLLAPGKTAVVATTEG